MYHVYFPIRVYEYFGKSNLLGFGWLVDCAG